jgi:uncharacterized membrane protein
VPEQRTPLVDHLCIFALSFQWIVFGSLHFSDAPKTIIELPDYIPFKMFVVIISGMIELTTGILILLPETRKWAAATSLAWIPMQKKKTNNSPNFRPYFPL